MWLTVFTAVWLSAVSIMDIRSRRVPVWLLLFGGIPTLLAELYKGGDGIHILLGALPGILLLGTAFATKKAGYGDGIVLLFLGMMLGGGKSLLLFGLSLFLISICSLILLALGKAGRNTGIPFLPFLSAAWLMISSI